MRSSWLYLAVVGSTRRSGLDLPRARGDREVRDRRVLGLTRSMRNHARVAGLARHLDGRERFTHRADLVELDQNRVADLLRDPFFQNRRVRHEHIVTDEL